MTDTSKAAPLTDSNTESGTHPPEKTAYFFADSDSQVFGVLPFARAFRAAGWRSVLLVDRPESLPPAVIDAVLQEFPIDVCSFENIFSTPGLIDCGAIMISSRGSRIYAFRKAFEAALKGRVGRRPALLTCNNGLVFEKFEEGMFWRVGYDFICLNGPRDRDALDAFLGSRERQPVIITGLKRLEYAPTDTDRASANGDTRKTFVFAEQVRVPRSGEDRRMMLGELARLAAANPDWRVLLKPRIKPNEATFHKVTRHVEKDFDRLSLRPKNFLITYDPLADLMATADLLGSVSSTAIFEALELGVPAVAMGNFGVRNDFGTHPFMASGLFVDTTAYSQLDELAKLRVDPGWLEWVGMSGSQKFDVVTAVEKANWTAGEWTEQFSYAGGVQIPDISLETENVATAPLDASVTLTANDDEADRETPQEVDRAHGTASLLLRSRALMAEGGYREARNLLFTLVNVSPTNHTIRLDLAYCYAKIGDLDRARQQIDEVHRLTESPGGDATADTRPSMPLHKRAAAALARRLEQFAKL